MNNKRGQALFIIGFVALVLSITIFAFALPLINTLINAVVGDLGTVELFFVRLIPFVAFFLIVFYFLRLMTGGGQ